MFGAWKTLSTVVIGACWGLFGLVWVTGAAYNALRAPAVRQRSTPASAWLVGAAGAWVIFRAVPKADWSSLRVQAALPEAIGLPILFAATAFTLWARAVLGTMWTASAAAKDAHVLHTEGPYAVTRHPIYTGILGMLLGTALASGLGRWLGVFVLAVVWVKVKVYAEERLLTKVFGEDYQRYRRRVPQLIPGLRGLTGPQR